MISASEIRRVFESYLQEHPLGESPETLYDPVNYMMSLGGKRMRPVLLLLAYSMWQDNIDEALPAAQAIEVFHNFSLVHDDIMDDADVRRGQNTVHVKFGQSAAILGGDVMLIKSFDFMLQACSDQNVIGVMEVMIDASAKICEGQQLDLDFESRNDVGVDEYLHMNSLKTAILLGASLQIGALLAGAPGSEAEKLYQGGLLLGKAFQIQDDVLDAYGDEAATGKKRGGDILNAKKTILYTALVESLPNNRKQTFSDLYQEKVSNPEVKIQQVLGWFDTHSVRKQAEDICRSFYERGIQQINNVEASSARKVLLEDYIGQLLYRQV